MESRVIIVTGGNSGLGKSIVDLLVKDKQNIVLIVSNDDKSNISTKYLKNYYQCDISDYNQVIEIFEKIFKKYEKIDVLINNAGILTEGEFNKSSYEMIEKMIKINTIGTMNVTRAIVPSMIEYQKGYIINIVSQGGLLVSTTKPLYNTSKWAITGFTKCLEEELIPYGIKVTGIFPATIKTNLFAKNNIPNDLKKAIEPGDIAKLILFLIYNESSLYISDIGIKFYKRSL